MRQVRMLRGWRLWTTIDLATLIFFSAGFSLFKLFSSPGSRWDISWSAVAGLAATATLIVSLWTFLSVRTKG